jgi:hypothetical protein
MVGGGKPALSYAAFPEGDSAHSLRCPRGGSAMYDVRRVRRLCEEIAIEQDDEKAQDLIELLGAVMRDKNEEITFHLAVLRSKYSLTYDSGAVKPVLRRGP